MYDPEQQPADPVQPCSGSEPSRYRAHLLADAQPSDQGLWYRRSDERSLLAWSRVWRAFAAEVGEPEGVRTIVFDLVIGIEGRDCVALRFGCEPGESARSVARAIELGVEGGRCDFTLQEVAAQGFATTTHPDLESRDEACLRAVRSKPLE